eukprot:GILK01002830.1.p1 GENE.GILK01002830.1~~GILK01002830.1.p1  ORF type:complete len:106 (+),score=6.32 GILK01002830.1:75-392(+)
MTFVFRDRYKADEMRTIYHCSTYKVQYEYPGAIYDRLFDLNEHEYIYPNEDERFPVKADHVYQVCYAPEIMLQEKRAHEIDSLANSGRNLRFRGIRKCLDSDVDG